jgi:hypothetical protein
MKEAPTKESIIASLTDAEVLAHFKQRVFDQVAMADLVGGYEPEDILECLPIANVVGFAVRSLMENFGDGLTGHLEKITCLLEGLNKPQLPTNGSGAVPKSHTGFRDGGVRKPKVTVIGMKPNQINETRRKLGEKAVFNFVDKNRSTDYIPEGTDIVGVMANFVSHADQNHAINHCKTRCKEAIRIIHKGGVKRMCILLNDAIRQKTQVALV